LRATVSWLIFSATVALWLTSAVAQPAPAATQIQTKQLQAQPIEAHPQPHELKVTEYSLPPDKLAKAEALYQTRTVLYLFGMVFGIVVLCVLLKLRVAPAFRDLAERASKNNSGLCLEGET